MGNDPKGKAGDHNEWAAEARNKERQAVGQDGNLPYEWVMNGPVSKTLEAKALVIPEWYCRESRQSTCARFPTKSFGNDDIFEPFGNNIRCRIATENPRTKPRSKTRTIQSPNRPI